MKILDSTTKAYRLNGNVISDASLDAVLNEAYAILANNDEIASPFEEWEEEVTTVEGDTVLSYYTKTDTGKEMRISFSMFDMTAKIMLLSGDDEFYVGEDLLCTVSSGNVCRIEEWL